MDRAPVLTPASEHDQVPDVVSRRSEQQSRDPSSAVTVGGAGAITTPRMSGTAAPAARSAPSRPPVEAHRLATSSVDRGVVSVYPQTADLQIGPAAAGERLYRGIDDRGIESALVASPGLAVWIARPHRQHASRPRLGRGGPPPSVSRRGQRPPRPGGHRGRASSPRGRASVARSDVRSDESCCSGEWRLHWFLLRGDCSETRGRRVSSRRSHREYILSTTYRQAVAPLFWGPAPNQPDLVPRKGAAIDRHQWFRSSRCLGLASGSLAREVRGSTSSSIPADAAGRRRINSWCPTLGRLP